MQKQNHEYSCIITNNTPQSTNYTATCLPSRKLSELDEPDKQDTAGEAIDHMEIKPDR